MDWNNNNAKRKTWNSYSNNSKRNKRRYKVEKLRDIIFKLYDILENFIDSQTRKYNSVNYCFNYYMLLWFKNDLNYS